MNDFEFIESEETETCKRENGQNDLSAILLVEQQQQRKNKAKRTKKNYKRRQNCICNS